MHSFLHWLVSFLKAKLESTHPRVSSFIGGISAIRLTKRSWGNPRLVVDHARGSDGALCLYVCSNIKSYVHLVFSLRGYYGRIVQYNLILEVDISCVSSRRIVFYFKCRLAYRTTLSAKAQALLHKYDLTHPGWNDRLKNLLSRNCCWRAYVSEPRHIRRNQLLSKINRWV